MTQKGLHFSILPLLGAFFASATPATAQLGARQPVSEHPLVRNQAAVESGERRFQQLCGGCHGPRGEGGQGEGSGPNLVSSWEVRRANDARLSGFIRNGIPGTAMPPFRLPDEQIVELAAFVRSLNAPAVSTPVSGDPASGKAIFTGKGGCVHCHMIQGSGGFLGPDLSNVGGRLRLDELRKAILNRDAIPNPRFRPVLLQIAGTTRKAVMKHESLWSLQVLDENGNLHLLHGPEMRQVTAMEKSWMPGDYGQSLTPMELENLLAFLSRLAVSIARGAEPVSKVDPQ